MRGRPILVAFVALAALVPCLAAGEEQRPAASAGADTGAPAATPRAQPREMDAPAQASGADADAAPEDDRSGADADVPSADADPAPRAEVDPDVEIDPDDEVAVERAQRRREYEDALDAGDYDEAMQRALDDMYDAETDEQYDEARDRFNQAGELDAERTFDAANELIERGVPIPARRGSTPPDE